MHNSVQQRLSAWLTLSILIVGALTAALTFVAAYEDANDLQDRQLTQLASVLAQQVSLPAPTIFHPRTAEDAETHFVVRALGASAIDRNPELDLELPPSLPAGLQTVRQDDVAWRVLVRLNAAGQRFAVAQRMTVRDEEARAAAVFTLLPLLVCIPALLLVVRFALRRTFAPLAGLSEAMDQVDDTRLAPLDLRAVPLEVQPFVQAVNRLLRRLDQALEQQRRLVGDAAHELRTPLAALTVQADNVLHVVGAPARARMESLRSGLSRMSTLVEQLLDFARIQAAVGGHRQRLELQALAHRAIEECLPLAHAKGIDLGCLQLDRAAIEGDPVQAYALVRNAVDNAVRYTPPGGSVDVAVESHPGLAVLVIQDTGPGIAPEHIPRVFEPFVRILGNHEPGSGLGLAIAQAAARSLGGSIELGARADGRSGLMFTYRQVAA